jgi:uncharacterized membrane protein YfcA
MDQTLVFHLLLLLTAFLYAAVGHGGASGYLALMALYGFSPDVMKPTALLLNLFVSLTAFIQYYRSGHFRLALFLPLAIASVPMAFLGGTVHVDASLYKKILGLLLLVPIARFLFIGDNAKTELITPHRMTALLIGAGIGLLSGLIGIGGGIILSPALLLLGWTDQKQTAAISAIFIFVNSFSGLAGQLVKGIRFSPDMLTYVAIAFLGGLAGAYLGARKFNQASIRTLLAIVLIVAAYKLLFTNA